ncbi:MAG: hypothetical protein ACRBN8_30665 [Nannocystales bacterium]
MSNVYDKNSATWTQRSYTDIYWFSKKAISVFGAPTIVFDMDFIGSYETEQVGTPGTQDARLVLYDENDVAMFDYHWFLIEDGEEDMSPCHKAAVRKYDGWENATTFGKGMLQAQVAALGMALGTLPTSVGFATASMTWNPQAVTQNAYAFVDSVELVDRTWNLHTLQQEQYICDVEAAAAELDIDPFEELDTSVCWSECSDTEVIAEPVDCPDGEGRIDDSEDGQVDEEGYVIASFVYEGACVEWKTVCSEVATVCN